MAAMQHDQVRGELLRNEPLARHTTWRVGGPARSFFRPADEADLAVFLSQLPPEEPILWLGLGSNLLVRDAGFAGTVIAMKGCLSDIEIATDLAQAEIGAGAACAKVARECARAGLTGAAFLAGIPGTMGGALAMNAGAFGGETWCRVLKVRTLDRAGVRHTRNADEFAVAYRQVQGRPGEWFVGCTLQLEQGDVQREQADIRALLERRGATQPIGLPSCGSTFRNPPGDHAARLIEACGLKGYRIGGAEVSPKHANFVINTGHATAKDIERLIEHMRAEVERQHQILLHPEVHIVGEPQ